MGLSSASRQTMEVEQGGVRVRTLIAIRWGAIAGQLIALVVVGLLLGFPLPWGPALAAVGAAAAVNLGLHSIYRSQDRIDGRSAWVHLAFDLVQISTILALTGGLANPFALWILVPVTISATLLSARQAALLVLVALALLLTMWFWHMPLPWGEGRFTLPATYRAGILVAIALGTIFLTFYAWKLSAEGRRRQAALIATQAALERESRMGALGSLAAAAAHELGGPLGTITLIANDLEEALGDDPFHAQDVSLLRQEARRCRDILRQISARAEAEDPFPDIAVPILLREVLSQYEPTRVPVELRFAWEGGQAPVVRRSPELLHGLSNFLSNALRHARAHVWMDAGETETELWIAVSDDGPGFASDLLPRLGEPFLGPSWSRSGSTGLGIFIATTLVERIGGRLGFFNLPEGGARVELRWWRSDIEPDYEEPLPEGYQ